MMGNPPVENSAKLLLQFITMASNRSFACLLIVIFVVWILQVQSQPAGPCHQLVLKSPNGQMRIFNMDSLTSLPDPFVVGSAANDDIYAFRVCSNLQCGPGGPSVAACHLSKHSDYYPVAGAFYQPPNVQFLTSYKFGAVQFNLPSYCTGKGCLAANITVVCDPLALYVAQNMFLDCSADTIFLVSCVLFIELTVPLAPPPLM
jgi:hypothetical protein